MKDTWWHCCGKFSCSIKSNLNNDFLAYSQSSLSLINTFFSPYIQKYPFLLNIFFTPKWNILSTTLYRHSTLFSVLLLPFLLSFLPVTTNIGIWLKKFMPLNCVYLKLIFLSFFLFHSQFFFWGLKMRRALDLLSYNRNLLFSHSSLLQLWKSLPFDAFLWIWRWELVLVWLFGYRLGRDFDSWRLVGPTLILTLWQP